MNSKDLLQRIRQEDRGALARAISLVENESSEASDILLKLNQKSGIPVIGVTGPPGAGKSSLVNCLSTVLGKKGKSVGILAVDPSSPFSQGALLGDRVRMSDQFADKKVFIRSLATRGYLGGISAKTWEITDLMKEAGFDMIFVETAGVGQSEVDIISLADVVLVVLVPGSGDAVQALKSGLMEIADVFAVNKSDREGATLLENQIREFQELKSQDFRKAEIVKTSALEESGIEDLLESVEKFYRTNQSNRKALFMARRAYKLIEARKMKDISISNIEAELKKELESSSFNLYRFVERYH